MESIVEVERERERATLCAAKGHKKRHWMRETQYLLLAGSWVTCTALLGGEPEATTLYTRPVFLVVVAAVDCCRSTMSFDPPFKRRPPLSLLELYTYTSSPLQQGELGKQASLFFLVSPNFLPLRTLFARLFPVRLHARLFMNERPYDGEEEVARRALLFHSFPLALALSLSLSLAHDFRV